MLCGEKLTAPGAAMGQARLKASNAVKHTYRMMESRLTADIVSITGGNDTFGLLKRSVSHAVHPVTIQSVRGLA